MVRLDDRRVGTGVRTTRRARGSQRCGQRWAFVLCALFGWIAVPTGSLRASEILTVATGEFQIPPHSSHSECFYTDVITDRELSVAAVGISPETKTHHLGIYYTMAIREPQRQPCGMGKIPSDWTMIWVKLVRRTGRLPAGLAVKVPRGAQIGLEAHHINDSDAPQTVNDVAHLHLVDPAEVDVYANRFWVYDLNFEIPSHTKHQSVMTCTVPGDLRLVSLKGHMHELGTRYTLEIVDEAGRSLKTLYDAFWEPGYTFHAPLQTYPKDDPLILSAGTRLRQTCRWNNTTDQTVRNPDEMCLAVSMYYPDQGQLMCKKLAP